MTKNSTEYYVYGHYRKDTNTLFYVGKGKNDRSRSKKNRNDHWKRIVAKHGYDIYYFAEGLDEKSAFDLERAIITDVTPEANYAEGGFGGNAFKYMSSERVAQIMASRKYTKSVASYGFKGRSHSEETKAKVRAAWAAKRLANDKAK